MKEFDLLFFMMAQDLSIQTRVFHFMEAPHGTHPETFQINIREQSQLAVWNSSAKPTSGASLIKLAYPHLKPLKRFPGQRH